MVTRFGIWLGKPGRIWTILALATALRVLWALLVPVHPIADGAAYDAFAREIAAGHGYRFPGDQPTVYWPVGPAALYAAFYMLLGVHGWVVSAVNVVLGVGLVAAIWRIGCLRFDARVGAIAALLAAIWPLWIEYTSFPNGELPSTALMAAAFAARDEPWLPRWARILLSTALLVAAAFMRPTVLPLIVLLPLLDGAWRRPMRAVWQVALALVVAALLIAPWAERNRALFGAPVPVSANFGANLWMGNNPATNGGYMGLPERGPRNEVQRDAYFKEEAKRFIVDHPLTYLKLCLKRVQLSFDRESIGVVWNADSLPRAVQGPLKAVSALYWYLVFAAGLAGVILFLRDDLWRLLDPLFLSAGMFAAVAVLVVGMDRYHMGMMPFIALFGGYAVNAWLTRRAVRAGRVDPANHYQNNSFTPAL